MIRAEWARALAPRQQCEILLADSERLTANHLTWLRAGQGDRRGLSLGVFHNAVNMVWP